MYCGGVWGSIVIPLVWEVTSVLWRSHAGVMQGLCCVVLAIAREVIREGDSQGLPPILYSRNPGIHGNGSHHLVVTKPTGHISA